NGIHMAIPGPVTQLTVQVVSPTPQLVFCIQGKREVSSRDHLHDAMHCGNRDWTKHVGPKARASSRRLISEAQFNNASAAWRSIAASSSRAQLAKCVVAPAHNVAIAQQRERMASAGGNLHHVIQSSQQHRHRPRCAPAVAELSV